MEAQCHGENMGIFDTLSEYVYVADMDTHDLVYMNQMALKAFGVSSLRKSESINAMHSYRTALPLYHL